MAIAFRSATSGNVAAATSITINLPSGVADNDIVIANSQQSGSYGSLGTPDNETWTLIAENTVVSNPRSFTYFRRWKTGDSTTETFNWGNSNDASMVLGAFSGADTTTALDVTSVLSTDTANTTTPTLPEITTVTNDCMLVICLGPNSSTVTEDPDGNGFTEHIEITGERGNSLNSNLVTTSGGQGTFQFAQSSNRAWSGLTIALRPAAAAQTVNLDFQASASTLYALDVDKTLDLDFQASASTVYALTVAKTEDIGFIASTSTLYALDIDKTLDLDFIDSTSTLYAPTITKTENIGFVDSSSTVYALTATIGGQIVNLDFIASSSVLYAPTVAKTVDIGFVASTSVSYALDTDKALDLGFIDSTSTLYALTLAKTLDLDFIVSSSTLYDLDIDKTVDLAAINSTSTVYALDVDKTVDLGFIASTSVVYSLTATLGGVQTVNLGFIPTASVIYSLSANNAIIEYESTLLDYELYSDVLADYELYQDDLSNYELYSSDLEDNMPIEAGTIAKKLTLTLGDDHTGSFVEPDTVTFYLEYPNSDPVAFVYLTDNEVTKHPTIAGLYIFNILASQDGAAYVQAKAVWIAEVWTEITSKQKVTIERFIGVGL